MFMDTYIGQQLEQYKIEAHIGTGSSGTVYRATDVNLVRPVVLKLLKPSITKYPNRQQQVLKAAQSASRLSHPAIVPFYDFGQQNGHLYLVTALVEGISLDRVLGLLALDNRVLRLDETLTITVTDNGLCDGSTIIGFELQNITGGQGTRIRDVDGHEVLDACGHQQVRDRDAR